jgi:hypothetical protein
VCHSARRRLLWRVGNADGKTADEWRVAVLMVVCLFESVNQVVDQGAWPLRLLHRNMTVL